MARRELSTGSVNELVQQLIPSEELKPSSIDEVAKLPSFFRKIQEYEKLYGKKYSELDHDIQNALVLRRLQQMTNTLMLNPIWKERIGKVGLTQAPQNFEEWQQLPLADKETMRELFMGLRKGLVVPLSYNGFEIVASGGTSDGLPVETVYSMRELHDTYKIAGNFMGQYVLRDYLAGNEPKWVMTTLADYQMWSSGTMVGGVLQHIPGVNYIGAGPVMKEVYQHIMSYQGPKAIMAISAGIAILTDLGIGLNEEARNSFRVALHGSGLVPYRKQIELKEMYPNLVIMSYFAATQAETIGLQLTPQSYLTAVPGLHLIEIVDDQGRWVDEGEEGELVVTRLHAHEAPLPRLKIGDRMVRRPNIDRPNLKAQQFEFSGRSGDVIHLGDTQYAAPQAYDSLCRELKAASVFDLDALANETQFLNNRKERTLSLIASVDDAVGLRSKIYYILGAGGVRQLFVRALTNSLSMFNQGEANSVYLEKSSYQYEIKLVEKWSKEIYRTQLGKVPLIRDIF